MACCGQAALTYLVSVSVSWGVIWVPACVFSGCESCGGVGEHLVGGFLPGISGTAVQVPRWPITGLDDLVDQVWQDAGTELGLGPELGQASAYVLDADLGFVVEEVVDLLAGFPDHVPGRPVLETRQVLIEENGA
jgi:hypothetical protein